MANDVVIRAESVGKKYTIGHQGERERYVALRDVLARGVRNAWRKTADTARGPAFVSGDTVEEFWALRDVSFEVKRGEVLGIIGRNGAGKSTLLKILSRITEPSEGRVTIQGRVASLLEVGTGFHPELTGRENIYLNGAILGMSRVEIRRKFDEIVAFAGIDKFLDTPVKRYSSGMYVRLAFAVAAHLEPEILIVDEVLAVGDTEFQKKCLGKMSQVASTGKTVLFVSHNMAAVQRLCSGAMVLDGGKVLTVSGEPAKAIQAYTALTHQHLKSEWTNSGSEYLNQDLVVRSVRVEELPPLPTAATYPNANFVLEIEADVLRVDPSLSVGFCVYLPDGQRLFWSGLHDAVDGAARRIPLGRVAFRVALPAALFNEGEHEVEVIAMLHNQRYLVAPGAGPRIRFVNSLWYRSPFWDRPRDGLLAPQLEWGVELRDHHKDEAESVSSGAA